MAFTDIFNSCVVFFGCGFVDAVELVGAAAGAVGRDDNGFERVDFLKLKRFGISRASHAREFFIQAEVVLEGDGCHGQVFSLNGYAFFGFNGLVQAIAPASACHEAASELVHNDDFHAFFALLHYIVLVAVVQVVST